MKVVLFCGGLGMRLRESDESLPKPLIRIGPEPILWHVMKYYAHFGHTDFILCLGYRADAIKAHFLADGERVSEDSVFYSGADLSDFSRPNTNPWRITFVDSGVHCNIGERLKAAQRHVENEEMFFANYADGLTDLHLPDLVRYAEEQSSIATLLSVKPNLSYHFIDATEDGTVREFKDVSQAGLRINGGFYVFRPEIFSYLKPGEDLVGPPFQRLVDESQLRGYVYDGFWASMDTFKDKARLEALYARGDAPWVVWDTPAPEMEIVS